VIAQASRHFVTPMMASPLVDHADVPSDVRDYFAAVSTLTTQQSKVLLDLTAEIVSALQPIGAQPVLLKGIATLAEGLYPSYGARLMTDIDVLITDSKMRESIDTLAMRGCRQHRDRRPIVRDVPKEGHQDVTASLEPHHNAPLYHEHTGIRIELHRAFAVPPFAALLSAHDALRRAAPVSADGITFAVLAPADRIVHHILHAQLHHKGAQSAVVGLRQLVDLAILIDAFGSDIDWTDVEFRFASNGYADVLADYLAYLALLLDRRVPARVSDLETVMARLRAGVESPQDPKPSQTTIGAIASEYWTGFRRRPARAINLIDPRFWPDRLRHWRDRLWPGPF
jgi:hypothetical protein